MMLSTTTATTKISELDPPTSLNEYEKLVLRMNTPRVIIDNATSSGATIVKVDSARNHIYLLNTVQVLVDLNLSISKAYISSDGPYFMDVFHVVDHLGHKLADPSIISAIEQSIQTLTPSEPQSCDLGTLTALELTGIDRIGLLSEIFAVISDLGFSIAQAKIWAHDRRIGAIILVENSDCEAQIGDLGVRLRQIIRGSVELGKLECHLDRRMHQMMVKNWELGEKRRDIYGVRVVVENLIEVGYSIVNVECRDRPKLLFDAVCVLTDLEYVVFHGNVDTDEDGAHLEFYIRRTDGTPISSESERQRVIQYLQAAIERRSYSSLRLELSTIIHKTLLSDVTRAFRENGLLVTRAEISKNDKMAANIFYVTDANGNLPEVSTIENVRQRIGGNCLQIKEENILRSCVKELGIQRKEAGLFCLGSLVLRNLCNLGLIRSCS